MKIIYLVGWLIVIILASTIGCFCGAFIGIFVGPAWLLQQTGNKIQPVEETSDTI